MKNLISKLNRKFAPSEEYVGVLEAARTRIEEIDEHIKHHLHDRITVLHQENYTCVFVCHNMDIVAND